MFNNCKNDLVKAQLYIKPKPTNKTEFKKYLSTTKTAPWTLSHNFTPFYLENNYDISK